LKTNNKTENSL